ncbi:hypothetical protein AB0F46_41925 [Streptomyces sp. NPDC026665]|uniref:hypothetical protein n=1 Tax=Streptomyces sp. NPDC026665 TaxID=3154798 RepID=UPI0034034B1D
MSGLDQQRQRAAAELLSVWTGDSYDASLEKSEDSSPVYVPLAWAVDTAGHLYGELPRTDGVTYTQRVERLRVWADYLGIDLLPAADGAMHGEFEYTPEGPCGVMVRVTVITPG